jgi:large conductance mechanosensitive channel
MKIKETLKGFKQFILRGNAVDLAVGVLVGGAFGTVVTAIVKDLFTPLIAAIFRQPDFSHLEFTINGSQFLYGDFINAVISLAVISLVIYFFVILPINALVSRSHREPPPDPTTKKCSECLSEIPITAKRCAFCTQLQ